MTERTSSQKTQIGNRISATAPTRSDTVIAFIGGVGMKKAYLTRAEPLSFEQMEKMSELFGDMFFKEEAIEDFSAAKTARNSVIIPKEYVARENLNPKGTESGRSVSSTDSLLKRKNAVNRRVVATIQVDKVNPEDGVLSILQNVFGFSIEQDDGTPIIAVDDESSAPFLAL